MRVTRQRESVITDVNNTLSELRAYMIDNGNLDKRHVHNKGLHLNGKGIFMLRI